MHDSGYHKCIEGKYVYKLVGKNKGGRVGGGLSARFTSEPSKTLAPSRTSWTRRSPAGSAQLSASRQPTRRGRRGCCLPPRWLHYHPEIWTGALSTGSANDLCYRSRPFFCPATFPADHPSVTLRLLLSVQWATKCMTPASMYFSREKGSRLLRYTVPFVQAGRRSTEHLCLLSLTYRCEARRCLLLNRSYFHPKISCTRHGDSRHKQRGARQRAPDKISKKYLRGLCKS